LAQVLAILFVCSIDMGTYGYLLFHILFGYIRYQYLSSGALVKPVNNITVTERVKTRTVVLHLN